MDGILDSIYGTYNFEENSKKIYNAFISVGLEINKVLIENKKRIKALKKIDKYKKKKMGVNKLIYELDYVKTFEDILEKNSFYKYSVKNTLDSKFNIINAKFYYKGFNKIEELNSKLSIEFGKSIELEKYLRLLKSLIEEFENSSL